MTPATMVSASRRRPGCREVPLADALDDHGHALATAHAHRLETDGRIEGLQVVDERRHDAGTGHPEGMAEGDGAAVGVELVLDVDSQLVAHGEHLGGERLVE